MEYFWVVSPWKPRVLLRNPVILYSITTVCLHPVLNWICFYSLGCVCVSLFLLLFFIIIVGVEAEFWTRITGTKVSLPRSQSSDRRWFPSSSSPLYAAHPRLRPLLLPSPPSLTSFLIILFGSGQSQPSGVWFYYSRMARVWEKRGERSRKRRREETLRYATWKSNRD